MPEVLSINKDRDKSDQEPQTVDSAPPLSAMDRRVKRKLSLSWPIVITIGLSIIASLAYSAYNLTVTRTYKTQQERLTISEVIAGTFEDFIPVRGIVTPLKSVYLDAIEGGQITRIMAEEGNFVKAGQELVELKNTNLQLEVIGREAQVTEQLNNLRNTNLSLEQNRLQHKRDLVEIDYQITRISHLLKRQRPLLSKGAISGQDVEELEDELDYYQRRREITLESQEQDERFRSVQVEQLEESIETLKENLVLAGENLQNLIVKAPISGQLTSLNAEIGESKAKGERLGQIDEIERYKITAQIDEFYLNRLAPSQRASFEINGITFGLEVAKIYPEVQNGEFEVDLIFGGTTPQNIRRGQSLQLHLALGESAEGLLIPNGAYYQDTGGRWLFVLDPKTGGAERRNVSLGRRNTQYVEVLGGLLEGDRVVTSSYQNFDKIDRIEIEND